MYQFLRRIPIWNRTIAYDIVNRDLKWKSRIESTWQQRDRRNLASIEHLSKRDANAGDRTSVCTLTRMGCNPYANYFSYDESCVFEFVVIFTFRENYLLSTYKSYDSSTNETNVAQTASTLELQPSGIWCLLELLGMNLTWRCSQDTHIFKTVTHGY